MLCLSLFGLSAVLIHTPALLGGGAGGEVMGSTTVLQTGLWHDHEIGGRHLVNHHGGGWQRM